MLSQIGSLKGAYSEWVNKPVDRPLRLFGPDVLEILTKTPWWAVPLFWIPSILYIVNIGINEASLHDKGFSSVSTTYNIPEDNFHLQLCCKTFRVICVKFSLLAYCYGLFWSIHYIDGCFI